MADIFLSYSSSDRPAAQRMAAALEQCGWSVWWDRKIPFGKTFDEVIEQNLAAARCVIVLWSTESIKSRWVRAEADQADQRGILLPVQLEDGLAIPMPFGRMQTANLVGWESGQTEGEFDELLRHIGNALGPPRSSPQPASSNGPDPTEGAASGAAPGKSPRSDNRLKTEPVARVVSEAAPRRKAIPALIAGAVVLAIALAVAFSSRKSGSDLIQSAPAPAVPTSPSAMDGLTNSPPENRLETGNTPATSTGTPDTTSDSAQAATPPDAIRKRAEMYQQLRQTVDQYNDSAKRQIDAIGR